MKIGIMYAGYWSNPRYFIPKPLLSPSTVEKAGYQQYRWLKFYFIVNVKG
jgi:hypothetical protein